MLTTTALPGAVYQTTGSYTVTSPTFIIPISAINTVLGSFPISNTDGFENLLYGLLQALYLKNKAGTFTQVNLGVECANKSVTQGVYEQTTNVFANTTLVNYLVSFDDGVATTIQEVPANLQIK